MQKNYSLHTKTTILIFILKISIFQKPWEFLRKTLRASISKKIHILSNEPLGAEAPPLVEGGGPTVGGVGIPLAHDQYIVNTAFTMYYHGTKNKHIYIIYTHL